MKRTFDPTFLNVVANDPSVRPWLGGTDPLDLSALIADVNNVAFETEHGGFVLQQTDFGIYEAHSMFLEPGRGREAYEAAKSVAHYIFVRTNGLEIVTKVPANNDGARGLARLAGFSPLWTVKQTFPHVDGPQDVTGYRLRWDEWTLKADDTYDMGSEFHGKLASLKVAHGSESAIHADDEVHDRFAGFCALCVTAGNAAKGVYLYNQWARLSGYATIALLSEHPCVIDIRDAVLEFDGQGDLNRIGVLSCQ